MSFQYCLLALSLSLLLCQQPATGQGVTLELNGSPFANFGLLAHNDIDTSDDVVANTSLVCRTDNTSCCRGPNNPNGTGFGSWFYPGGDMVLFAFVVTLPSGVIYRQRRRTQAIRLYRDNSTNITATANGIYRCEVADQNGVTQTRYVGLYTEGAGVVSISEAPQFSLISEDPLEFTLTSMTTGGPPTTAEWTLPGGTVITVGDGFTQTLLDGTADTFEHTLTVTGRLPGVFMFSTTNARNGAPDTSSITVQVPSEVVSLEAHVRFTSIVLTWSEPFFSTGVIITHYEIIFWPSIEGRSNYRLAHTVATAFTLSNLELSSNWTFEVAAFNALGRGAAVTLSATTLSEEDGAQFQLQLSPVEHCTTWSSSRAQQMRRYIHTAIVAAIAKQEVESFESSFLLDGFFRCWHSPTEVTYRSSIIGPGTYNASQLVAFLQDWVDSRPVVRMEEFELQVLGGGCPVALSSLSALECPPSNGGSQLPADPTLITRDPAVIECVNICLFRRGGTVMCT